MPEIQQNCSNCSFVNPPGSKFCQGCGKSLAAAPPPPIRAAGAACPKCGHMNPPASKFCEGCGTSVAAAAPAAQPTGIKCSDCGFLNPDNSKFCQGCGKKIASAPAAEASSQISAPQAPTSSSTSMPVIEAPSEPLVVSNASIKPAAEVPQPEPIVNAETPSTEFASPIPAPPADAPSLSASAPAPDPIAESMPASPAASSTATATTSSTSAAAAAAAKTEAASAQQLCTNCGVVLEEGSRFCQKCGARTPVPSSSDFQPQATIAAPVSAPHTAPSAGPSSDQIFVAPQQSSSKGTLIMLVLVLIILGGASFAAWRFYSRPDVTITVTDTRIRLAPGDTASLLASVTGSNDTDVVWSIKEGKRGGRLEPQGVSMVGGSFHAAASYFAPQTDGTFHVVATSHANSNRSATIEIVVGDGAASNPNPNASSGAATSLGDQIVGTWQWPKPSDDLRMEIASDGSVVLASLKQPDNLAQGTYKVSGSDSVNINLADGRTMKWQVLTFEGDSMRVISTSRDGVSAMTFTRVR